MDELDDYLGCRIDNRLLRAYTKVDEHVRNHWNRCPFCGASRGLYGAALEQHRPRCRYKGNADSSDVSVPNYYLMLDEDDRTFLPTLRAIPELAVTKRKLETLLSKLPSIE